MVEFSIERFTEKLKEWFVESTLFPYYEIANNTETEYGRSRQQSDFAKHPNRHPTHLKDVTRECFETSTIRNDNSISFDYGNAVMERNYPHYHILEDSQIIRKRNKGTKKTKGSQDTENILAKRDYGKVTWNGKTFTKEYSRNVRGSRNRMNSVSHWTILDVQSHYENADSSSYWNVHYKYIENILDQDVVQKLASYFGLKRTRKIDSGLGEEHEMQNIINILDSHDI